MAGERNGTHDKISEVVANFLQRGRAAQNAVDQILASKGYCPKCSASCQHGVSHDPRYNAQLECRKCGAIIPIEKVGA